MIGRPAGSSGNHDLALRLYQWNSRAAAAALVDRYIDAAAITPAQRSAIYESNARRVCPRLDAALKAQGQEQEKA